MKVKSKADEGNPLGNNSLNSSNLLSVSHSQNDLLRSNFQNMPIYETQEDLETTKKNLTMLTVDFGDEYEYSPMTNRLSTQDKAFITNREKVILLNDNHIFDYNPKLELTHEADMVAYPENIFISPSYTENNITLISLKSTRNNIEEHDQTSTFKDKTEEIPLKYKHKSQQLELKSHREYRRTHTIPTLLPLNYK
jgi:hypothetical protein